MFYVERDYGATIDGTLGIDFINFDATEDDKEEILEKLYPLFLEEEENEVMIPMYCFITEEDIDIEVDMNEYKQELLQRALIDEEFKDDEFIQKYLQEVQENIKEEVC